MAHSHEAYRRHRRDGWRALDAWRAASSDDDGPALDWRGSGGRFVDDVDGFTLTFHVEPDEYADADYLGTLCDDWRPGAILTDDERAYRERLARAARGDDAYPGRDRGAWRYFVPEYPADDRRDDYSRAGMARHVADCRARADVERDYRALLDYAPVVVVVEAWREGVRLGTATLGGVDGGDDYVEEVARELADEALDEARATLARLVAA